MKKQKSGFLEMLVILCVWGSSILVGGLLGEVIVGEQVETSIYASYGADLITYAVILIVSLCCMKAAGQVGLLKPARTPSFRESCSYGIYAVFIVAAQVYLCYDYVRILSAEDLITTADCRFVGVGAIVMFVAVYFAVGFTEEIICRGILFLLWEKRIHSDCHKSLKAAAISSLLFGLVHLIHLVDGFNSDNLMQTSFQVVYASMFGMYFCAVLWKGKNLWICIVIHALIDFPACLQDIFLPYSITNQVSETCLSGYERLSSILAMLAAIPAFVWAIIVFYRGEKEG